MTGPKVANADSTGSHGGGFAIAEPPPINSAIFGTSAPNTAQLNGAGTRRALPGNLRDNGIRVLRVGDTYLCPIHGPNPIVTGSAVWFDCERAIVRQGDSTQCGAVVDPPVSPEWGSE